MWLNLNARLRANIGAAAWLLSLQYYVVQVLVASHWQGNKAFSLTTNTISDLGNTHCGPYGARFVCSPLHAAMNASFITLGVTMIVGSLLFWSDTKSRLAKSGLIALIASGIGSILVGLFPENTVSTLHITGAALAFILGNIAIIILGSTLQLPCWLKGAGFALGGIGLIALVLFELKLYGGLHIGGMERLVAYPQSIWMILVGAQRLSARLHKH